ncbi:hypothetical protein [Luteimonas sp. MC1750]|uniref:hypothetical protein n=1 Tax=Luteimonas sp. MC1750 TaxID=2799326 RepID=UPI0018F0F360|nr:hypothetical protein [Luteimonas sp. MC1750]MBJ6985747.1 hypothetical protein [Luteimonas sp. MC1750]QQO05914.1 hypothetical protein JGR68_00155 [Luteimonas sp. MC1750]
MNSTAAQEVAPPASTASGPAQIVVNRDTGKMGSLCATELYVDGALVGRVQPGQSTTVLAPAEAKELLARPALESYICKKIYSLPQWERRAPLNGQSATFRYGFNAKGEPFMEATQ